MNDALKTKLMGWSASVGLVALGLLGHSTQSQAALPGAANAPGQGGSQQGPLASGQTTNDPLQVAQSSPPPPPPLPPAAVGGVRG
jgi:hypothetical protein